MKKVESLAELRMPARPNLRKDVYSTLRTYIIEATTTSDLPIHLQEAEIAKDLGVSRTPVREALNRLEQEGVVKIVPYKGIILTPISIGDYLQWLEVREPLEGVAAARAAEHMEADAIAEMLAILEPFTAENAAFSAREYGDANARFHMHIVAHCGNDIIKRVMSQYNYIQNKRFRMIERSGRTVRSMQEHQMIMSAIARRDAAAAEAAAMQHVRSLRDDVSTYLNSPAPDDTTQGGWDERET